MMDEYKGYEDLAVKTLLYAVEDYKRINRLFMRSSPSKKKELIQEKEDIEAFLLSEKFNYTDISGEQLLKMAKNRSIPEVEIE